MTARPRPSGVPTLATLRKYGLTEDDFRLMLAYQGGVCAVCGNKPNGRWNIDHEHRRGWKKLSAEMRKRHVRGILCWFCNKYYMGRSITIEKAQNVVEYLKNYQDRKPNTRTAADTAGAERQKARME